MVSSSSLFSTTLLSAPNSLLSHRSPRIQSPPASLLLRKNPRCRRVSMALSAQPSSPALEKSVEMGEEMISLNVVGENDLLIVGPGVLGRMVAEQWQQEGGPMQIPMPLFSLNCNEECNNRHQIFMIVSNTLGCQIYGQTMTADHHDELMKVGINPSIRGTKFTHKLPYVIFCAPPSRTVDYPDDVRLAASNWSGEGGFLFTSSTALYDCSDNGICDENTPVVPLGRSSRTDLLLNAEDAVLEVGGCVIRLADRGAHVYWLRKGTVESRPDHVVNLIHYEDAASLSVAILKKMLRGRVFLGSDNHPLSRQDLMDAVIQSGKFTEKFLGFTGTDGPLGKRLYNWKTRAEVGWDPKYPSFRQFLGLTD
ncbi:hypothetical protein J5N97_018187 [Dioscorea zingiberensis]|uniref:NAD(P)-binding Rossmann-fold superfamily protein n=1 Tax=Dioscorea zingiberensis TaxID=325984 RepID=A0A9D5CNK0_9LILI|nr:hypothetical protein J5N97_018187 [Dioscorea zingiberensis]